jgi:hypothetical protein
MCDITFRCLISVFIKQGFGQSSLCSFFQSLWLMAFIQKRDIESNYARCGEPPQALTIPQCRFIRACTGTPLATTITHEASYLKLVSYRLSSWQQTYHKVLHNEFHPTVPFEERMLLALTGLVNIYQTKSDYSISRLRQQLTVDKVVLETTSDDAKEIAEQWIFAAIGVVTLLLHPLDTHEPGHFEILTSGARNFSRQSHSDSLAARPIVELLRAFGEVLPKTQNSSSVLQSRNQDRSRKFHVSYLNTATLQHLAHIELVWVECIGSHLSFDATIPALYIFKLPSFCNLHKMKTSILEV